MHVTRRVRVLLSILMLLLMMYVDFSVAVNCESTVDEATVIREASLYYGLDEALVCAVRKHEAGKAGKCSKPNKNGSIDCGPMQINSKSVWRKELEKRGISYQVIKHNACVNIWAGAWILAREIHEAKDFWSGVGHYHSRTPKYKNRYIVKVYNKWKSDCI